MKFLVLNAGSSSLKFALFDDETEIVNGKIDRLFFDPILMIGKLNINDSIKINSYKEGLMKIIDTLIENKLITNLNDINYIGHRVVHGKDISKTSLIDENLLKKLEETIPLAPLHNPPIIETIKAAIEIFKVKNFAVFDTAFHQTIPKRFYKYPIPDENYYRRYGFHGISHKYVYSEAKKILKKENLTAVTMHLGNGCSMALIKDNNVIHTTMGFTPLEGLIMGTRSGSIDPGIVLDLARKKGIDNADKILNKQSGFLALTGFSDIREIRERAKLNTSEDVIKLFHQYDFDETEQDKARLAMVMYADRIIQYATFYSALENIDCYIFTAGIGENVWQIRKLVSLGLKINIDDEKNMKNETIISNDKRMLVIKTNEELQIVREIKEFLNN
ncbi:MAG: acetate/propionate family kinase [Candidatus Woesearchaeota archaeon]